MCENLCPAGTSVRNHSQKFRRHLAAKTLVLTSKFCTSFLSVLSYRSLRRVFTPKNNCICKKGEISLCFSSCVNIEQTDIAQKPPSAVSDHYMAGVVQFV